MRVIGMDVHRVFAEAVALLDGAVTRLGCEFRRSQPAIPIEASHLIRVKPAGHSD
jgi:hypothetical protein